MRTTLTLLVEGHQGLGDRLADGVDLGDMTATVHADTDVHTGELLLQGNKTNETLATGNNPAPADWATSPVQIDKIANFTEHQFRDKS